MKNNLVGKDGIFQKIKEKTIGIWNDLSEKIKAFNWDVIEIDGHDIQAIYSAIGNAKQNKKPTAIIANTIKGKGVSFMQNNAGWHGKAPKKEDYELAMKELE